MSQSPNRDAHPAAGTTLVVGGAGRLGPDLVRSLMANGFNVVQTEHRRPVEGPAPVVAIDLGGDRSVIDAVAAVESRHGPIDRLVVNAVVGVMRPIVTLSGADMSTCVDVNLTGAARVIREVGGRMRRRRFGRIVVVSSVAATVCPPGTAAYSASKAGVEALVRVGSRELAARGVTVNAVACGVIEDGLGPLFDGYAGRIGATWLAATPLRRLGAVGDVANAVQFFLADAAGAINGCVLPVDGGYTAAAGQLSLPAV